MTNTSKTTLRVRASFVAAGLASLLGGCVIEAKIGDDPLSDGGETTHGDTEWPPLGESSTTVFPGYTSGAEPGTASATGWGDSASTSATSGWPGSATSGGSDDEGGGVDPETALELCGVQVVPPESGSPVYYEGIECSGGCVIDIETSVYIDLYESYGECLCEAMGCGPLGSGSTSSGAAGETDGDDPDGCGPFPPGDGGFTCACEMCSIDVTNVDGAWVEGEADLEVICECMCGGAGCGLPL